MVKKSGFLLPDMGNELLNPTDDIAPRHTASLEGSERLEGRQG
jgi:hypothetical protein